MTVTPTGNVKLLAAHKKSDQKDKRNDVLLIFKISKEVAVIMFHGSVILTVPGSKTLHSC